MGLCKDDLLSNLFVCQFISGTLDSGEHIDIIIEDFEKAFDKPLCFISDITSLRLVFQLIRLSESNF